MGVRNIFSSHTHSLTIHETLDDKILLFWDLSPGPSETEAPTAHPRPSSPSTRPDPIAFAIPYAHPLHSVASHPSTSKELVVSDAQGSVFVVDWRVDPADEDPEERYRGLSIAQLIDPRALADARTGMRTVWGGSVAWQQQDSNLCVTPPPPLSYKPLLTRDLRFDSVGAAYGSRWSIWDLRKLQGGKPIATGPGFIHGTHRFRYVRTRLLLPLRTQHSTPPPFFLSHHSWCPTSSHLFALSSLSPLEDATIHIHNTAYAQSTPRELVLRPRPHRIRDFDWIGAPATAPATSPRFAAAVGRNVLIVQVGPDEPAA